MKVLAEGAEAVVYETTLGGLPALLKRRMQKKYRVKEMDSRIRAQRSRSEARIIGVASKAGISAPKLLLFDRYDVYMTEVKGKKLGGMGESDALFEKIGRMLGRLHEAGVTHGDYTPANIIVGKEGPCLIDFGLSEITESVEGRALDVLLMKRSVSRGSYLCFVKGYGRIAPNAKEVLKRLDVIERRGRYQTRTLT